MMFIYFIDCIQLLLVLCRANVTTAFFDHVQRLTDSGKQMCEAIETGKVNVLICSDMAGFTLNNFDGVILNDQTAQQALEQISATINMNDDLGNGPVNRVACRIKNIGTHFLTTGFPAQYGGIGRGLLEFSDENTNSPTSQTACGSFVAEFIKHNWLKNEWCLRSLAISLSLSSDLNGAGLTSGTICRIPEFPNAICAPVQNKQNQQSPFVIAESTCTKPTQCHVEKLKCDLSGTIQRAHFDAQTNRIIQICSVHVEGIAEPIAMTQFVIYCPDLDAMMCQVGTSSMVNVGVASAVAEALVEFTGLGVGTAESQSDGLVFQLDGEATSDSDAVVDDTLATGALSVDATAIDFDGAKIVSAVRSSLDLNDPDVIAEYEKTIGTKLGCTDGVYFRDQNNIALNTDINGDGFVDLKCKTETVKDFF